MLYLHHSNQLEVLADHFAQLQQNQPLPPFQQELVVVQNSGMGRWLSLQTARHNGIAANIRYLFPAEMTWELLRQVLPNDAVPEKDPCAPATLRWRLLALFLQSTPQDQHEWEELQSYLATGAEGAWQLAGQLAKVFDQYLFFRPQWIMAWEQTDTVQELWQARLWWRVAGEKQLAHWVRLQERFNHALSVVEEEGGNPLPPRISFFSVPVLSPSYVKLLEKVSQYTDVHIYLLNPSAEYWGDIESEKRKLKQSKDVQALTTVGNPLLASWGRQGRDFLDQLIECNAEFNDLIVALEPSTLLQQVQSDILHLRMPEVGETVMVDQVDRSLVFHVCHSPMREAEVLYDQLLALFAAHPDLTPADVVIMTPDIDNYAPYLAAVLGNAAHPLPFSIADSNPRFAQGLLNFCQQLLELPQTRSEAESLLAFLEFDEVREHLGLDENQVLQCRQWIRAVNIRWGMDASTRAAQGGAQTHEHTWRYGLDRLLLGYVLPGEDLFAQVLPYNEIEGSLAEILGRLQSWLDVLFEVMAWAEQTQSFAEWDQALRRALQALLGDDAPLQTVWQALDALQKTLHQADFDQPLVWGVFKSALAEQLDKRSESEGFLGRGITCCALMPMRTVPFRFVALIGMNDGVFPRRDHRASFDRMAQQMHRGDRLKRDEDRYLFLESVLSARDWLYISYVGLSAQDNNPLPPSVLVSELRDYVQRLAPTALAQLTTVHPLQAFSPKYPRGENGLFTYTTYFSAESWQQERAVNVPFWLGEVLPEPDASLRHVNLERLTRFFQQPARTFLQQRLGLRLYEQAHEIAGREPFAIELYQDGEVRSAIFQQFSRQQPATQALPVLRAKGLLPHGELGDLIFAEQVKVTQAFYQQQSSSVAHTLKPLSFSLVFGEFQLTGLIKQLTVEGRKICELGRLSYWQWLGIWLQHLVLNAVENAPCPRVTKVYGLERKDEKNNKHLQPVMYQLRPIADAHAQLQQLLEWYWQGLCAPLPFFPKSAFEAVQRTKEGSITFNPETANNTWSGETYRSRECDKPEYRLLYRGENPLQTQAQTVERIAQAIFGRCLAAQADD